MPSRALTLPSPTAEPEAGGSEHGQWEGHGTEGSQPAALSLLSVPLLSIPFSVPNSAALCDSPGLLVAQECPLWTLKRLQGLLSLRGSLLWEASPVCLLGPDVASSSWTPRYAASLALQPHPEVEGRLLPNCQPSTLTSLALAAGTGMPMSHSDRAGGVVNSPRRGPARQKQVVVMAAVRLRGKCMLPLASQAG